MRGTKKTEKKLGAPSRFRLPTLTREAVLEDERRPMESTPGISEQVAVEERAAEGTRGTQAVQAGVAEPEGSEEARHDGGAPLAGTSWQTELSGASFFRAILRDVTRRQRAEEELRSSEERLRSLAAHLQSAREEERSLIAREIHDELGQALTALRFDLVRLAGKPVPEQPTLVRQVEDMLKIVDGMIQSVRRICTELRPGLLDDLGLVAAIEWQAQEFRSRTGIECQLWMDDKELALASELSTALFRIAQEALTNVARHSEATRVDLSLREEPGRLRLVVRDDGRGITPQEMADNRSLGLLGMRERAALFGGGVTILGKPGRGTTVIVDVPRPDGAGDRSPVGRSLDPK